METTKLATHDQVRAVSDIIAADPSIPVAHKNVLQTIFSMLLNISPFVLDIFASKGANLVADVTEAIPQAFEVVQGSTASAAVANHEVGQSLQSAVQTAITQPGTDPSFLDKILAFILKILPTVIGLFSHNPASVSTAGNAAAGGPSQGSQSGGATGGGAAN